MVLLSSGAILTVLDKDLIFIHKTGIFHLKKIASHVEKPKLPANITNTISQNKQQRKYADTSFFAHRKKTERTQSNLFLPQKSFPGQAGIFPFFP